MSAMSYVRSPSSLARVASVVTLVSIAACAGAGTPASQVHTSVRVEPTTAVRPVPQSVPTQQGSTLPAGDVMAPPPALPSPTGPGPALAAAPERRLAEVVIPAGTSIASAVSTIGSQYGLTVSVDPEVQGTAQANLRNVTLEEALDRIVTSNGARYQLQGRMLRVIPVRMETRSFSLDYVALSRVGTMSTVVQRRLTNTNGPIANAVASGVGLGTGAIGAASGGDVLTAQSVADIWQDVRIALTGIMQAGLQPVGNASAQNAPNTPSSQVSAALSAGPQASSTPFADGSVLVISPTAGLITVTAFPDKIARVEQYIGEFQASVLRQVKIEAKIVEVRMDRTMQFGIDWNVITSAASNKAGVTLRNDPNTVTTGQTGNVNFTFVGGGTTINAVLTALESQGDVKVLNNETTTALNNQRAIFQVTDDQVFFNVSRTPLLGPNGGVVGFQNSVEPQQISVGVVLDVLPQISADNVLTMNIRPAVTNITNVVSITLPDGTQTSAPNIARREGDTVTRLRAGETTMIGGLVQNRTEKTVGGIPLLKDIPLIGKLFQHIKDTQVRSELVVFLTPTIISGQPATGR